MNFTTGNGASLLTDCSSLLNTDVFSYQQLLGRMFVDFFESQYATRRKNQLVKPLQYRLCYL